jgi:hypothetical protein
MSRKKGILNWCNRYIGVHPTIVVDKNGELKNGKHKDEEVLISDLSRKSRI